MRIVRQPFRPPVTGVRVNAHIHALSGPGSAVRMAVAYARATGVLRIAPALKDLLDRGGAVEAIIGIGHGTATTRQGIEVLRKFCTRLYVFCNPASTFHPKIYLFRDGRRAATVLIGSSNLTPGGLYMNYEVSVELNLDLTSSLDRSRYQQLALIFRDARHSRGQALLVESDDLIKRLAEDGLLADETVSRVPDWYRPRSQAGADGEGKALFEAYPPAHAPPIDPSVQGLAPTPAEPTGPSGIGSEDASPGATPGLTTHTRAFVMELDNRDTKHGPGFSPEVYIPKAARDEDQAFWGWPSSFSPSPQAGHPERRVDVLVTSADGISRVATGKRFWYYEPRYEFRFGNSRELIEGSAPGDILVVRKRSGKHDGQAYEYEAQVIPAHHPDHAAYQAKCVEEASDLKSWGYFPTVP